MSSIRTVLSGAALALVLSACNGGGGTAAGLVIGPGGGGGDDSGVFPKNVYELADQCVKIKADGQYIKADGTGFTAAADATGEPVLFYMKATGLNRLQLSPTDTLTTARYAFYTKEAQYVTGAAGSALPVPGLEVITGAFPLPLGSTGVTAEAAPSDGADWTFKAVSRGTYNAVLASGVLSTDADGALLLSDTEADFAGLTFEKAEGCTVYPEMPVNVAGGYTGPDTGELVGYADIHAHMAMGSDMSDGSGDRGPSAGGVMYGHAVDRFGVTEALKDCTEMHGPMGITTAELVLDTAPDIHDNVGWPTFVNWPARDSQLHQQMYWKFVERSWKAGQRLMVLHGTNIEALCDVAKKTVGDKQSDCTDMGVGMGQVAYAYDMQDYIDAQYGGPGEGWFRIVQNSAQAENVIRAGKMAVIPGLEFSNIFKCNVTYVPGMGEVVGCDKEMIDQQIEEAWNAGVRGIFLYHDVDSALGGTGIFSAILNVVGFYGTKGWWQTYTCDDENGVWSRGAAGLDNRYFYNAGTAPLAANELEPLLANPIGAALIEGGAGTVPVYPAGDQCNARGVTELGKYALRAAMKKGFLLDLDHAEISIKQAMLDEGKEVVENGKVVREAYPMISAHGGHGGFTNAQVLQMLKQGGIMYPGMINGREYMGFYEKVEAVWDQMTAAEKAKYPIAVGYGADQNGLANQPGPRGGDDVPLIDYENGFTLFAGPGFSPRLQGVADVAVSKLAIEGGQSWSADDVGVAHYGMVPDVVEQIRLESALRPDTALKPRTRYLDAFYRSADAYVRLWKQTERAAALRPEPTFDDESAVPMYVPHPIDPTTGPLGLPVP